jgi:hypothetical protein
MWEFLRPALHRSPRQPGVQIQAAAPVDLPAPGELEQSAAIALPETPSTDPSEESRPPAQAQQGQGSHEAFPGVADVALGREPDDQSREIETETAKDLDTRQDAKPLTAGPVPGLASRRRGRRLVKPEHVKPPALSAEQRSRKSRTPSTTSPPLPTMPRVSVPARPML